MHETAFLHLISNDSSFPGTTSAARSRVIETKYGKVQGLSITLFPNSQHHQNKNYLFKNKVVEIYLGIPYASPPIKTHRFSPTQTPIPWDGIKSTVKPGFVCPQMMPDIRNESAALNEMPKGYLEYLRKIEPYFRNQSEDCLYLNIYTPIGAEQKLRPVLVYIHGGKFAWGSGNLSDGTVMAAYADVLFVTLNYRLGVLGFLNTNPSPSTKPRVANYGLMDQIAALHWIKENIMSFGGDPENITLMGYEAGAACIHFLMSSPTVTQGLFHRSILIAGSSHAPWALVPDPAAAAVALSQALNCTSSSGFPLNNSTASAASATTTTTPPPQNPHGKSTGPFSSTNQDPILDCLKNKHFSYFTKFYPPKFSVDFGPSIDGVVIKNNYRVSGEGQMGKRDVSKKYDLLFGVSSLEKLTAFSETDLEFGFEAQRRDAILRTLVRNSYRFHLNEILATITNEYTDWEKSVQHPIATRDLTVNAVTDCLSVAPVVAASDSAQISKSYFYVFEHSTKDGLYNYQRSGAGGGEEVNYILGAPLMEIMIGPSLPFVPPPLPSNYSKNEMALSELLLTYISNFVHNGDPNEPLKSEVMWPVSKERNRFKNMAWEPYDRLHQKYLEISTNKIRTRSHYRAHQMAVWLRLVPELQKSGAQFASNLHNRLKGGSDPSLYVGSLKLLPFEEELPNTELEGYIDSGQANFGSENSPPSPPTTCFSPLSAAPQGNANADGSSVSQSAFGKSINSKFNETSLEPSYFTPYSTALSITIAIGCSLLILNVFIFALVYYQRDKKRAEKMKSSHGNSGGHQSNSEDQNKYGEPPELLKSNSTTASTLHHSMSQSQLQNLVQSDSCHSHGSFNIVGQHPSGGQQQFKQSETMNMGQMGIVLSPSQSRQNHPNLLQHSASVPPQMLAVATLPRSNGGVGANSNLTKPQPPPRTTTGGPGTHTNFSTLPHNIHWSAQNLYFVILFGYIIINIIS